MATVQCTAAEFEKNSHWEIGTGSKSLLYCEQQVQLAVAVGKFAREAEKRGFPLNWPDRKNGCCQNKIFVCCWLLQNVFVYVAIDSALQRVQIFQGRVKVAVLIIKKIIWLVIYFVVAAKNKTDGIFDRKMFPKLFQWKKFAWL